MSDSEHPSPASTKRRRKRTRRSSKTARPRDHEGMYGEEDLEPMVGAGHEPRHESSLVQ
jgi:hypothetical protein